MNSIDQAKIKLWPAPTGKWLIWEIDISVIIPCFDEVFQNDNFFSGK